MNINTSYLPAKELTKFYNLNTSEKVEIISKEEEIMNEKQKNDWNATKYQDVNTTARKIIDEIDKLNDIRKDLQLLTKDTSIALINLYGKGSLRFDNYASSDTFNLMLIDSLRNQIKRERSKHMQVLFKLQSDLENIIEELEY